MGAPGRAGKTPCPATVPRDRAPRPCPATGPARHGKMPAMRQLLLLRHAKSSWDDPRLSDHARPLNARGKRAALAMAEAIRTLGLMPDVVLVSSARRTLQTLEALTPIEGGPIIEPMDELYLAPWPRLLEVLRGVPETARSVLLVGHNPGMHELAMALAGPAGMAAGGGSGGGPMAQRLARGYPTGTLAEFTIASAWRMLEPGSGRLVRFLAPGDLAPGEPPREPPGILA
jgi:phosphohistidine phosphatase